MNILSASISIEMLVVILIGIIAVIAIIRFMASLIFKAVLILAIGGAGLYFYYFYSKGSNEFLIQNLNNKYCIEQVDTVKCNCIVGPLYDEIKSRYSPQQIEAMKNDALKTSKALVMAISTRRSEIMACLDKHNATHALDEFMSDLKSIDIEGKINTLINKMKKQIAE